jgi:hypothetical protein
MTEQDKREDREDLIGCNVCAGLFALVTLLAWLGVV